MSERANGEPFEERPASGSGGGGMTVRSVHDDDFDAIAALTNRYIRDTAIHFGETEVTAGDLRDEWRRSRERYPYLVAIGGSTSGAGPGGRGAGDSGFLGYAKSGPWRTRSAYRHSVEVGIYMEPRAQGRGLGARLYRALIDACIDRGFHAIIGGITMPNEASVRLHERLGFRPIGVFPEVGRKFDRWHDVGFWQLTVSRAERRGA